MTTLRFVLACIAASGILAVAAVLGLPQAPGKQQPITFTIVVPVDAQVVIDGHQTTERGTRRVYQTPALSVGKDYHYTLRVTAAGRAVTRKVTIRHGGDNTFDLRADLQAAGAAPPKAGPESGKPPYNILFIICDQEAYRLFGQKDYKLPAREALKGRGVTFRNHYISSAMCTPSRASFFTGTAPQNNGVFDQMEYGIEPSLRSDQPNMASVLKGLGYQTAYFGKFELNLDVLLANKKTKNTSTSLQPYGIDVFNSDGDASGEPYQGFQDDPYFAGEGVR
jgi:uncharacterized protein (TIGR03000 family)